MLQLHLRDQWFIVDLSASYIRELTVHDGIKTQNLITGFCDGNLTVNIGFSTPICQDFSLLWFLLVWTGCWTNNPVTALMKCIRNNYNAIGIERDRKCHALYHNWHKFILVVFGQSGFILSVFYNKTGHAYELVFPTFGFVWRYTLQRIYRLYIRQLEWLLNSFFWLTTRTTLKLCVNSLRSSVAYTHP